MLENAFKSTSEPPPLSSFCFALQTFLFQMMIGGDLWFKRASEMLHKCFDLHHSSLLLKQVQGRERNLTNARESEMRMSMSRSDNGHVHARSSRPPRV
jgi:hypothetical protein